MYNLKSYRFGDYFRKIRKAKNISIKDMAEKLSKTPTTIYKYERNEVLPDVTTILEICNVLEVDFNELCNKEKIEENIETTNNPFNANDLYLYYLGFGGVAEFKLEIRAENGFQKVYFIVPDEKIFFVGSIESNQDIAFINMKNYYAVNNRFEKIMLIINLKYSKDDKKTGVIIGTKEDVYTPVVKKCIVTSTKITDKKDLNKRLFITDEEIEQVKTDGFWYPNIANESGFKSI